MCVFEPAARMTRHARLRGHACFVAGLLITTIVTVHAQLGHSELFKYGTLSVSELPKPGPSRARPSRVYRLQYEIRTEGLGRQRPGNEANNYSGTMMPEQIKAWTSLWSPWPTASFPVPSNKLLPIIRTLCLWSICLRVQN